MSKIEYENLECSDELLNSSFNLLYQYNLFYLFGHILICIESFCLKAPILGCVNLISIAWFIYNGYKMKRTPIEKYINAEIRMTIELIIHQVVAYILVGPDCGFQYILLASSCTLFTLYKNHKSKQIYIAKSLITVGIFVILEICSFFVTPFYNIEPHLALTWTIGTLMYSFFMTAYFTLKSYKSTAQTIEDYKNNAITQEQKIQHIQREVISSMANIIESRDGSTGEHTKRTSKHIEEMLEELKLHPKYKKYLTDDFVNNLKLAAPLHDIGKIKVPDTILQKPGSLTKEEFEEIKKHAEYGGEIINTSINNLEDKNYVAIAYNVANYHHEKWDGTGYPQGLKGEEIPLEARIMALADVYDALTNKRCYKEALSNEEALKIINNGAGTQFEPDLAKIFINIMKNK